MSKLSFSEKAWDNVRPSSVTKTGLSAAMNKALKLVPGADTAKLSSTHDCIAASVALQSLQSVLGESLAAVDKAKDDKKGAAKLLKVWSDEVGDAVVAVTKRKSDIVEAVTAPVVKRWAGLPEDLVAKVQGVISLIREADTGIGHAEKMVEECVMGMVHRAGELRETGHAGSEPQDFVDDAAFKAAHELWNDQIALKIRATKLLEQAESQQKQIKSVIKTMYDEVTGAAKAIDKFIDLDTPAVRSFKALHIATTELYMEAVSDKSTRYAVFTFLASFAASSIVRSAEDAQLVKRFAKIKKIDAESYFEEQLAAYGLSARPLKKALERVQQLSAELPGLVKSLKSARDRGGDDPETLKQLRTLAAELDTINKRYIRGRANQEVAQVLSRPENAKHAGKVTQALAFFQRASGAAESAVKQVG